MKTTCKLSLNKYWLLVLIAGLTLSCNSSGEKRNKLTYHHDTGSIFATGYNIKYSHSESLEDSIVAELHRFDLSLNPFREDAIITKVNNNEEVELDTFFVNVFRKSLEISKKTNGYFDITTSPLINAWGFGFKNIDNVTPEAIDSILEFVGYEKISLTDDGKIVKTDPRVEINTSAIAKGYACDVIADLLDRYGVENYMVEIGGEVTAKGVNDKGNCWNIAVDKPIEGLFAINQDFQTVLSLCNKSLATSGNYRNFYIKDGRKYSHTIDPHTGLPSETDVLGATVIADDCMTADAYATAFMAMGLEASIEIAESVPNLHYYFIFDSDNDGLFEIIYSEGFEQFFAEL